MAESEVRAGSGKPLPMVMCPGCRIAMQPIRKKAVRLTSLIAVTYRCEKCETETQRTMRDD